jgi:hypothetical protein
MRPLSRPIGLVALALALVSGTAHAQDQRHGGWSWNVAPYVWATGIDGTVGLGPVRAEVNQSFSDILSAVDLALMMRVEGQGEHWGMSTDLMYVNLDQTTDSVDATATSKQWQAEVDGLYLFNRRAAVVFGARWWRVDNAIDFDNATLLDEDGHENWIDPVVGIVANTPIGAKWDFRFRTDVGGFGVGSDLSWQTELLFSWHATEKLSVAMGYRELQVDFDDEGSPSFVYDVAQRGLETGVVFHF